MSGKREKVAKFKGTNPCGRQNSLFATPRVLNTCNR